MKAQDVHAASLATSTALSGYYVANFIPPLEIIRALNRAGVRFLLAGTHGLGGWTKKPRATEDVDVLVTARGHKKAVTALLAAFPGLEPEDHEAVTLLRERETGAVRIDVIKSNQGVYRTAFKNAHIVQSGGQTYNVPSLELALAMKFAALLSSTRGLADKYMDAADFMRIARASPAIDLKKLHALGELIHNGDNLVEKVRQVWAGEKIEF